MIKKSVLIVSAHPDDEVLGCGGTIAKMIEEEGAQVHAAFLADGVFSRENGSGLGLAAVQVRRLAAQRAADILGIQSISFGDFPDNKMDTIPLLEIIQSIEKLIDRFKPEIIFTHHAGDLNVDHRRTHEATAVACRPKNGRGGVNTLLFFEIPSSTEWQLSGSAPIFAPNWFVDISKTFKRKLDALDAYHDELRDWPHPRSLKGVEHLARWRGATIGVDAAEAFILGRRIT